MNDLKSRDSVSGLVIRNLSVEDAEVISQAFAELGWSKQVEQFRRYFHEQETGVRNVLVAELDSQFAGYVTVEWDSAYKSFAEKGIPEISDLNVLPSFRRRGIATALLEVAETSIAERSEIAGIGVGMTPDYGAAQRLYLLRGYVPDGRGLTQNREPVKFRQPIVVDDSTVLWLTKVLNRR